MIAPLSIPSPDYEWQIWEINLFGWQLNIHMYALCILVGIILAVIITSRRLTKRGAEPGVVLDIALWAVPLGIIGARIYHVLTHPDDYFFAGANIWNPFQPGAIWNIWEGGNAIYGALIGGAIGVLIGCRMTGIRFWSFADALAPGLLVAQAVGRLGNWFNHELFGMPTDLPWGLEIESDQPGVPRRPGRGHAVPPDVPLRDHLEPRRRRADHPPRAPDQPALGQGVRHLPHLVRPRPLVLRGDPRRPERDVPRRALERLGVVGRRGARHRALPRAAPPAHRRRADALRAGP